MNTNIAEVRRSIPGTTSVKVLAIAAMLLLPSVLLTLSPSGSAQAQGGTVLAIDVGDVGGNSSTSVGTINGCFEVAPGATVTLDVVILNASDVTDGELNLNYEGVVVARSVADSLLNNESPDVGGSATIDIEASDDLPDSDGSDDVIFSNDAAAGSGGASGSGTLVRFTMLAPAVPGTVTLSLLGLPGPAPVLSDSKGDAIPVTTRDATLAVGTHCPAGSPTVEQTSPPQSPSPGPSGFTSITSPSPSNPEVSPMGSTPSGPTDAGDSGLPRAARIFIGFGSAAAVLGAALALSPQLRRRLWRRP